MEDKPDEYSGRQSDIYVVFGLESEIMRKNMQSVSHFITLAHLFVLNICLASKQTLSPLYIKNK